MCTEDSTCTTFSKGPAAEEGVAVAWKGGEVAVALRRQQEGPVGQKCSVS